MHRLEQKSGKNRRKFTILPDAIEIEEWKNKDYSKLRLEFRQTSWIRDDSYHEFSLAETGAHVDKLWLGIPLFMSIFGLSVLDKSTNPAKDLFMVLLLPFAIVPLITVIVYSAKKTKFRRLEFANGQTLSFYYRNSKEIDQVKAFIQEINSAISTYYKEQILRNINDGFAGEIGENWIVKLHEKEALTDNEYEDLLEKIRKSQKKKKSQ